MLTARTMHIDDANDNGEDINVDSDRSEDEAPNSDDLDAIDDSDIEENVDHAGSLSAQACADAMEAMALANEVQRRYEDYYDKSQSSPETRRRKRPRRIDSDEEDEAVMPTGPARDLDPPPPPQPYIPPLLIPEYVERQSEVRLVYDPSHRMETRIEELCDGESERINLAISVNRLLPLDFQVISDRDFQLFQALYLILCAAGEAEVEGEDVNCSFWSIGKRHDGACSSLSEVLADMESFYTSSYSLFRIFFHSTEALAKFSSLLLKCSDMLDQREVRAQGPSPASLLKRHINALPGLKQQRKRYLTGRIFTKPFQLARAVVFLAQAQGTLRSGSDSINWANRAAVPAVLTAAKPQDDSVILSDNWSTMFSENRVMKQVFGTESPIFRALDAALEEGKLLQDSEDMYRWMLSNTLRMFEYDQFLSKSSIGDAHSTASGACKKGDYGEKVVYYDSSQSLHMRIATTTEKFLRTGLLSDFRKAIAVVNSFKGTPSFDKNAWEYDQSSELLQAFHQKKLPELCGFFLEKGVRPGSAWLRELWLGVENGMLSNSLHGAVAAIMAVTCGAIRINEDENPNFHGFGKHSAGKSRSAEHVADLTGKIFKTMTWSSEQGGLRNVGKCVQFYPEGIESLTSTDDKHGQKKKFDKTNFGKSRLATIERANADGTVTETTFKNEGTKIYLFNDSPDTDHDKNAALFSRGIMYNYDNRKKNETVRSELIEKHSGLKNPPPQQMTIAESHSGHKGMYSAILAEGRMRMTFFNYYDACRAFLNWSVSVDTLGWIFEALKTITCGGQSLVTPRITNFVRIFMENYQLQQCVTSLFSGLDIPPRRGMFFSGNRQALLSDAIVSELESKLADIRTGNSREHPEMFDYFAAVAELDRAELKALYFREPLPSTSSPRAIILDEMLACMLTDPGDFVSRAGTLWDIFSKETMMFPGIDAAAASVGLVASPRQDESHTTRMLKEFLYSHRNPTGNNPALLVHHDEELDDGTISRDYTMLNLTRQEFFAQFSNHRSVSGDFKDAKWAEAHLATWIERKVYSKPCVRLHIDSNTSRESILFLKDFLSTVITQDEEKVFGRLKRDVMQTTLLANEEMMDDDFMQNICATNRWSKNRDNTNNERGDRYHIYDLDCACLEEHNLTAKLSRNTVMLGVRSGYRFGVDDGRCISHRHLCLLNSAVLVPDTETPRMVSSKAFAMQAETGDRQDDFSRGIAEIMHHLNIDAEKGKFRVTVPIRGSEFPLVAPDLVHRPDKKLTTTRVNPLFVPPEQRRMMSLAARRTLTACHTTELLTLRENCDNEDDLEKQHYLTCRLCKFLDSDERTVPATKLKLAIYEHLLSIRARQIHNDSLVAQHIQLDV